VQRIGVQRIVTCGSVRVERKAEGLHCGRPARHVALRAERGTAECGFCPGRELSHRDHPMLKGPRKAIAHRSNQPGKPAVRSVRVGLELAAPGPSGRVPDKGGRGCRFHMLFAGKGWSPLRGIGNLPGHWVKT
jgi:hypothetical protein